MRNRLPGKRILRDINRKFKCALCSGEGTAKSIFEYEEHFNKHIKKPSA